MLVTGPWLIVFNVDYLPDNDDYLYPACVENGWNDQFLETSYFIGAHLVLCFAFPVLVLVITNSIIFWNFRYYRNALNRNPNGVVRCSIYAETKHLILVTVLFIGSWLPLYGLMVRKRLFTDVEDSFVGNGEKYDNDWETIDYIVPLAQLLGASNSCVNPVLYAYHNKQFMKKLKLFCRRREQWRDSINSSSLF